MPKKAKTRRNIDTSDVDQEESSIDEHNSTANNTSYTADTSRTGDASYTGNSISCIADTSAGDNNSNNGSTGGNTASCSSSASTDNSSSSSSDANSCIDRHAVTANGRCEEPATAICTEIVITGPPDDTSSPPTSSCQSGGGADATAFEDATQNSNGCWPSSSCNNSGGGGGICGGSGNTSGQLEPLSAADRFATPAAESMATTEDWRDAENEEISGLTTEPEDDQDDNDEATPMPHQPSALYQTVLEERHVVGQAEIVVAHGSNTNQPAIEESHFQDQRQQQHNETTETATQSSPHHPHHPHQHQHQQQQQQRRRRSAPPRGVYGGPGTAFPATLLRRRLAAFPVVLPLGDGDGDGDGDSADGDRLATVDPNDAETAAQLVDRLAAWESADAEGRCGICQRPGDLPNSGGFLGYPVCRCRRVHARCALVGALLAAPDNPRCLGCGCEHRFRRVGRVKPALAGGAAAATEDACRRDGGGGGGGGGGGPLKEAWFVVAMATGLTTSATLLAASAALLLTLAEPLTRGLLAGASLPLLACLFGLLAASVLACFLIGWLLDRYTAAAWELVYSSRLQIAYHPDRLLDACDRVLAASLMACTFLEYRTAGYPFPKRGSAYVNYYCLKQPGAAAVSGVRAANMLMD